jgi:hypothetical protein
MPDVKELGEMRIMDPIEGDTKHIWDPDEEAEVAEMEKLFNSMRKKGFTPYKVNKKGEKTEIMVAFEADAGKIIFAPTPQGG